MLGFKGLKGKRASLPVDVCIWWCSVPYGSYLSRISATAWCLSAPPQGLCLSLAAGNLPRSGASWNENKDYSCYQGTVRPVKFKDTWEAGTYLGLHGLSQTFVCDSPSPIFKVASNTRPCSKLGGTTLNGGEGREKCYVWEMSDWPQF